MPDYRPNAPWVDLFTADEYIILCDWFRIDYPPSDRWIYDILDEWNIPSELDRFDPTDAAVAQILLERVQGRLPQWVGPTGAARPAFDRRAHRKVEFWPQRLFTINWADSAPGYSWPAEYRATYVPGFDRTVVTASVDCTEVFGVCDVAIGWFGPERSVFEGSHDIIVAHWSWQQGNGTNSGGSIYSIPGSSARSRRRPGLTRSGATIAGIRPSKEVRRPDKLLADDSFAEPAADLSHF